MSGTGWAAITPIGRLQPGTRISDARRVPHEDEGGPVRAEATPNAPQARASGRSAVASRPHRSGPPREAGGRVRKAKEESAPAPGFGAGRPDAQSAATAMSENSDASRMLPTTTRASVIMELLHVRARRSARAHRINAPLAIPA